MEDSSEAFFCRSLPTLLQSQHDLCECSIGYGSSCGLSLPLTIAVAFAAQVLGDCYSYKVTGPLPSDLRSIFLLEVVFSPRFWSPHPLCSRGWPVIPNQLRVLPSPSKVLCSDLSGLGTQTQPARALSASCSTSLIKQYRYWPDCHFARSSRQFRGSETLFEINKSMFGHKRKYKCGRVRQGTWVFSTVERGTGWALAFRVPNRTRETLVTGLVQKFVVPGTTIISDKFSPHFTLNSINLNNIMVNHSKNSHRHPLKPNRRCMESNQEKAEGDERDSQEQTSKLPRRVQLVEMLPWWSVWQLALKPSQSSAHQTKFT